MNRIFFPLGKIFCAGISGLLLTAAFPKIGADWLAPFAFLPLLWSLRDVSGREGFRLGFIMGLLHFLTLLCWLVHTMQVYGHLPLGLAVPLLFLLAAYLALYPAFFSMILCTAGRAPLHFFLLLPVLWTGLEYLRAHLLTGFPWELLGYSLFRRLHLIQIADILGVYGVSFLLMSISGSFFLLLLYSGKERWQGSTVGKGLCIAAVVTALAMTGLTGLYGHIRTAEVKKRAKAAPRIRVAAVQGNVDQMVKWDPAFQESSTQKYIHLSLSAVKEKPELLVWPETAVPFYYGYNKKLSDMVRKGIRQTGARFLIGSPSFSKEGEEIVYYNSAYLIEADGTGAGRFDKVHLVPFGEYVPLKKYLPFVKKIVAQIGDFRTGTKGETLLAGPYRLGLLICYEIIFPELSAAGVRNGAGLLVNITNDAWYGKSSAPYQHFSMAVFRAVENKRSLVRAANTGISGFIDPAGHILQSTELFRDAVITAPLPVFIRQTLYSRYGDVFAKSCLGIVLLYIPVFFLFSKGKKFY